MFTQEQMYFECYGMYCCESLKFPLEHMHRKDKQGFKKSFYNSALVGAFPKGIGMTKFEIVRRIEEYTKRTISNSDILKGLLGIFNAYERSDMEVKHYLGIPILPPMTRAPNRGDISKPVQVWTPAMGFLVGLCWDLKKPTERRSGFPSWSWTGWQSTVSWGSWGTGSLSYWPAITVDPNVKLAVECSDGQILSWEGFQKSKSEATVQPQISSIIRITAWAIQFAIVSGKRKRLRDKYEYTTWLALEDGGILEWQFESTSNTFFEPCQRCIGIFLDRPSAEHDSKAVILVLAEKGEVYERIGLCQMSRYKRFDKSGKEVITDVYDSFGYRVYGIEVNPPTLEKSWKEVRIA